MRAWGTGRPQVERSPSLTPTECSCSATVTCSTSTSRGRRRELHVQLDYNAAGIRRMNAIDYISSSQSTRVEQSRRSNEAKTVNISFGGWTLPRAGVAFVWVLEDELSSPVRPRKTR